jgi:peptidoglycan hydrolase-like protein with peptidoglycan-binding domain
MKTKSKSKIAKKRPSAKKRQTKKIIVASITVGAVGILGYFGWQYFKKKNQANGNDLDEALKKVKLPLQTEPSSKVISASKSRPVKRTYASNSVTANGEFPLKKGSKGEKVRALQQALISKFGASILSRYGADGDFGSETINALKKVGLPVTINESTFNVLVQKVKTDLKGLGKDLYDAAASKNFSKTLQLLKQMQSVADYSSANEIFSQYRLAAVRQTIVNGLLNTFTNNAQKEAIKFEFLRMGLQFDGNKWSLSGFDGRPIVTTQATTVWINGKEGVKVPSRMVLGSEVSKRLDYTLFENKGRYFLVNTKSIQYLS